MMAAAAEKKNRKVGISEEDVSLLLQRYSPTTILTLLQEVSQVASVTIDWNALVKRTATEITSAQEYQMLWRHLAYHHDLLEKIDDGAEPLDDESDLEIEVEAVPAASSEILSEAAACVRVLMSYGLPREHSLTNRTNAEASSSLNGFSDQTLRVPLDKQQQSRANRGTNVTVATLQRQSLAMGTSTEGFEGNGSGSSFPPKKKRKLWTKEEDMELIAAVQKFGEGNWSNILKGDFKHNRTASQLSQRWAIIRKRDANLLQGSSNKLASSTRSEERLATQKAISLALDMPKSGRLLAILSGGTQSIATSSSPALSTAPSDALPISSPPPNQQQQASLAISPKITMNTLNKPQTIPKKSLVSAKPSVGPNSLIQAAAFAAGGRIATPSTAASLFRAAQSKNAVHIRPGGGARSSPINNVKPLTLANTTGQQSMSARSSRVTATILAPSQANPMSVSPRTKLGGPQVQGCHGNAANNPLNVTSTNQGTNIESTSDTLSPEISEKNDDADSSAIDVDDLLVEEIKCEDDMEFDEIMAPDQQMDLLIGDISANEDNDFDSAYDAEATSDKQLDENENRTVNDVLPSDIDTTENKSLEVNDSEDHIPTEERPTLLHDESNKSNCGEHVSLENRTTSPICNDRNDNAEELNGAEIMAEKAESSKELHLDPTQEDASSGGKLLNNDDSIAINAKQAEPGESKVAEEDLTQGD
ncbi:uncharacterized protein LOC122045724 [Zingiber officinale]|uniref:Homeodomain-like superfamily protein n=1 Tax=Zingiber officinale TaxID=94328 RepID=A0A8J5HVC9_ZINOF|nr:uncharacterized protein LOC122045724 [Zingiber officinale]KAG6524103.1 hypothetical protein ZIOFF_013993 [Zingiber officinale]